LFLVPAPALNFIFLCEEAATRANVEDTSKETTNNGGKTSWRQCRSSDKR